MGDYVRTTKELSLHQVPTEVMDSIKEHSERYNLGWLMDDQTICIETTSDRKKKKKVMGIKMPMHVVSHVLLTPAWLIYAASNEGSKPAVMTVPLVDATVENYAKSPLYKKLYKKMPDNGYWVDGKFTGVVGGSMSFSDRSSIFIGLGPERAAEDFAKALEDAIEKTRR
jgi:hypothetical protein